MAIDAVNLSAMRRQFAQRFASTPYTKDKINAALTVVDDLFETQRGAINGAINAATAPTIFSVAEKKIVVALWAWNKFTRENV